MRSVSVFDVKARFSEFCQRVFETRQPLLVKKRGVPFVMITPVGLKDEDIKSVWDLRKELEAQGQSFDEDFEIPEKEIQTWSSPFDKE